MVSSTMDWSKIIQNLPGWHLGGKGSGIEDHLAALVVRGQKTATCSWFEADKKEGEPLPRVGDRSYIMNSRDLPVCVIEVVEVEVKPFDEVDADFARDEGEGDLTYAYWRSAHEEFFRREALAVGLVWSSETQRVVLERFKVLHVF